MKPSVCETCPDPGHCCRKFVLSGGNFAFGAESTEVAEDILAQHNEVIRDYNKRIDLPTEHRVMPFKPLERTEEGVWFWTCPKLDDKTGRCTIYPDRPETCIAYEPGTDHLCVIPATEKASDHA